MATGNGFQGRNIQRKRKAEIVPAENEEIDVSCSCDDCKQNSPADNKPKLKRARLIVISSDSENDEPTTQGYDKRDKSEVMPSWKRKLIADYNIGDLIGAGGFGTVYAGIRKRDNFPVALKVIPKNSVANWGHISGVKVPLEFELLKKVSGTPGIIQMVDWQEASEEFVLIMERPSPVIDLFNLRAKSGRLPERRARTIIVQLIRAVHYCHVSGVIHRDIKDENILLNREDLTIKLIDFGCGALAKVPKFTKFHGTPLYSAPEWFVSKKYHGRPFDVWSIGVLLYMLVENSPPFDTEAEIKGKEIEFSQDDEISQSCQNLIRWILCKDPAKRPDMLEILHHRWFWEGILLAQDQD